MSRKQLCCSQKQKIRKLKKRQRKKKNQYWISTAKTQQKTEILWRYKERRTGKKWNTIYYVVLVREKKKRHLLLKFCAVRKPVQSTQHFSSFRHPILYHMNSELPSGSQENITSFYTCYILYTPYIIPLFLYTVFCLE